MGSDGAYPGELPDAEYRELVADEDARPTRGSVVAWADPAVPPVTGHPDVDRATAQLATADPDDLDAQLEAGERVHRALRSRLSDLGG